MIVPAVLAAIVLVASAPQRLQISSARGVTRITLLQHPVHGALVPLGALARGVGGSVMPGVEWTTLTTPAGKFRFLQNTPYVEEGGAIRGLPASNVRRGDSLFVPLAFVSDILGDPARGAWRWNPIGAVLLEGATPPPLATATPSTTPPVGRPVVGVLRPGHHVTIDPGHGGTDPGNTAPGFRNGLREKDVNLAVGLLLRGELERRGVKITMTRTRDTLINLAHRAPRFCRTDCDLFVSLHVNSLDARRDQSHTRVRGFETYFLAEARTADAARVARMENEAIRYEVASDDNKQLTGLEFILKDLQTNEFLRESARAAELVQSHLREVHDGPDRGVKQAGFAVLTTARRPSILIEMGYSTNNEDGRFMSSHAGQQALASAIADAIVAYLREFDRKTADSAAGTGS